MKTLIKVNTGMESSKRYGKTALILGLIILIFISPVGAVNSVTKNSLSPHLVTELKPSQQVSFPSIESTVLLLKAMRRSLSDTILFSDKGSDQTSGIVCRLNKEAGGIKRVISPQEEAEKIRIAQEYIRMNNLSWTAGTTSVSNLTPEARAALLGLKHPTPGVLNSAHPSQRPHCLHPLTGDLTTVTGQPA
jgi:hypothetical protein